MLLTALAVMLAGVSRAQMPVVPVLDAKAEALAAANDPSVIEALLASGFCSETDGEEGTSSSGPHCAFCVVALSAPEDHRELLKAPRAPPVSSPALFHQNKPQTRSTHAHGLRAPPLDA